MMGSRKESVQSAVHKKRRRPAHARTRGRPAHARARVRSVPPRRVARLIVVTLVMALLGTGVWLGIELVSYPTAATTAGQHASAPPTVAVVGDSITALSRQSIATSLTQAGYSPVVHAVIGIEMVQAVPWIDQLAPQHPNDWIIELGTNDAGHNNPSWELPFLDIWHHVRSSGCVIYLSVSQRAGPIAAQINVSLDGLARAHANVHILDWGNLEYLNPRLARTGHDPSHTCRTNRTRRPRDSGTHAFLLRTKDPAR